MRAVLALLVLSAIIAPVAALTNCVTDTDCMAGRQYCSSDAKICVERQWVSISPLRQSINVDEKAQLMVSVHDPVGRASTYKIKLSGSGMYFAKFFGSQTEMTIALQAGETKELPLQFTPPSIKSFALEVQGVDLTYNRQPGGIYSELDTAYLDVQRGTGNLMSLSAPGPSPLAYLALALLAGGVVYLGGGKHGKS